jgi:hypothetical protein
MRIFFEVTEERLVQARDVDQITSAKVMMTQHAIRFHVVAKNHGIVLWYFLESL